LIHPLDKGDNRHSDMDRDENLQRVNELTEPWDVVVIGGGATGAYCALDAASRGFSVLLLEQHDFGKGTSSRSTKLIHGGVRYLRQGNISLVRESLRERALLLKNAPHVVHKLDFVISCRNVLERVYYLFGLKIYDKLAGGKAIGSSRSISRDGVLSLLSNVDPSKSRGGVIYSDAQFDDTRLLIDILRTACAYGATVLNYTRVVSLEKENGKVDVVEFEDIETGTRYTVNARTVINATGVFCSAIQEMSDRKAKPVIAYSQGVHLVFDRRFFNGDTALMIPETRDGRVLFCIPWNDHVLVGTTDTPVDSPTLEPRALDREIDFILDTASEYLAAKPTRADVRSVFAGIRPLVKKGNAKISSLSRSHELFVDDAGLVTITGGKWTTARKMAEDAIDKAIEIGDLEHRSCITENLPVEPPVSTDDDTVLDSNFAITRGAILRAVRDEMARCVEDVLARRTRALFLDAFAAIKLAPEIANIVAKELGRDANWINEQVTEFRMLADGYKPRLRSETED
jgi:glycerol-3-phosphate dehydrogenase